MNPEVIASIEQLKRDYPTILDDCLFKLAGVGWIPLIRKTLDEVFQYDEEGDIEFYYIKTYYGVLKMHVVCGTEEKNKILEAIVSEAESTSWHTCEFCGKPGYETDYYGRVFTVCEEDDQRIANALGAPNADKK